VSVENHLHPGSNDPKSDVATAFLAVVCVAWRSTIPGDSDVLRNVDNDPFNYAPARRKIGIIWRQTPDAMQMIGK